MSTDSAKRILNLISLASQRVRNAAIQYSTARGVRQVRQHSLIRFELEFQTVAAASAAILEILDNPLHSRHYLLDDRLDDWLSGTEPEACLETLTEMERLLRVDRGVQTSFSDFTPRFACPEDDINQAIVLFNTRKAHFHYLLTTDIWNYQRDDTMRTTPLNNGNSTPSANQLRPVMGNEVPEETLKKEEALRKQEALRKEVVRQKLKQILKRLDALDCTKKHRETLSLRQPQTCAWLLATDEYKSWRKDGNSLLWLQGKAGAGKSVLASVVIDNLQDTKEEEEFLAYFYCDFRNSRSTSAVEVLRSILAQLLTHLCTVMVDPEDLLDGLLLLKEAEGRATSLYNARGLSRHINTVVERYPRQPLIVVDALDECREVESLLGALTAIVGDVRIFATTRPLQSVTAILSHFPSVSMDKMAVEMSADILLHVTRELDSRIRLRTFEAILKKEICSKLCAKADGMFRWVQCQIDTLDKCTSISEIRRVLEGLPEGLEETYRRILFAIDKRLYDAQLVRRALVWLVAALRPMRLQELLEGLAVDSTRRTLNPKLALMKGADLLEFCSSLVVHHEDTDVITLSHMSVKEYLVGELVLAKLPRYHIDLQDANEHLARLCMAYIGFCIGDMRDSRDRVLSSSSRTVISFYHTRVCHSPSPVLAEIFKAYPLLKYVLSNGFGHLAHLGFGNADILKDMEALQSEIIRYPQEWDQICKSSPSVHSGVPWPSSRHDFVFYVLIAFASDALFQTLMHRASLTPRDGINPLLYAAYFGKIQHAQALLSRGANVNDRGLVVGGMDQDELDGEMEAEKPNADVDDCDDRLALPLEAAIHHWHVEMVDLLLAEGSTIPHPLLTLVLSKHPDEYPLSIIRRLLQTEEFAKWAHTPWDNQRLLEALVGDDDEDWAGEQVAFRDEPISAAQRLTEVGCAQNLDGDTLLHVAAERGCISVVEYFLSMKTPLPLDIISAALRGRSLRRTEMIRLLVNHGADVNPLAANGDPPLHVAIKSSDESNCLDIARILIGAGCNPCELDADDKPPIYFAVTRGFISVVDFLLSNDAPLPSRILFASMQVTSFKRPQMIRLLVANGADAHFLNPNGDNVLHVAMRSPDRSILLEIAQVLVSAGSTPSVCNLRGETPLHIAAKHGHHDVTCYLLLFNSSPDVFSLLQCDLSEQPQKLRSLIGNEIGLRFLSDEEDVVLEVMKKFLDDQDKCSQMAQVFIDTGRGLFEHHPGSVTLLETAVARGFGIVVEFLISHDVSLPSGILFTALRYNLSLLPLLIAKGANVHSQEPNGDTLLHFTLKSSYPEPECHRITHILVIAGCCTSTLNVDGEQPIHVAARQGFFSVATYLLSNASHETPFPPDLLFATLRYPRLVSARAKTLKLQGMLRLLLRHGADPHVVAANGDSVLHAAIRSLDIGQGRECLNITKILVEGGCNARALDVDGRSPLYVAVAKGFGSVVEYMLLKGGDIHARDANGNTLLHHAIMLEAQSQALKATKMLVEAGCSTSTVNNDGEPPIRVAITQSYVSVVKYLLSHRAPLPSDILLLVLRVWAAFKLQHEVLEMVTLLVGKGANVCATADGDTVLHVALACYKSWIKYLSGRSLLLDVVKVLVEAGCDPYVQDANGETALAVATRSGYYEVAEYLGSLFTEHPSLPGSYYPPAPPSPPNPPTSLPAPLPDSNFRAPSLSSPSSPHDPPSPPPIFQLHPSSSHLSPDPPAAPLPPFAPTPNPSGPVQSVRRAIAHVFPLFNAD